MVGVLDRVILQTDSGKEIILSPLIVKDGPDYAILGVDAILDYPVLLEDCLLRAQSKRSSVRKRGEVLVRNCTALEDIVKQEEEMFTTEIDKFKMCKKGLHRIDTGLNKAIYQKSGRIPVHFAEVIDEDIKKNLKLGILRKSRSEWCSRIVPVSKPDGSLRMCVDYRALNKITTKDRYPLPRIDEISDALRKAKFFTTLDPTSGYWQLAMAEEDKKKTAFAWRGGLYEYNRMPMGLCNAPATFQRTMDQVLADLRENFVIAYLDDIIIYSNSEEDHILHVKKVFELLKEAGISLNKSKCKFGKTELKMLGSVISEGKVSPDPDKVEAIKVYPTPRTVKEMRSFLGLANYCREYIVGYSEILRPLFALTKGSKKDSARMIVLDKEAKDAFIRIKSAMTKGLERAQPDFNKPFILTTDASDYAIGAILSQLDDSGNERMISAFSRNLDKAQLNYSVTDKELVGLVKGIENYRHYLLGAEFILRTDHRALAYLWETKNPNSRILRWSLKLQEYNFKVEYIKGENNPADGLSRIKRVDRITID